MLRNPFNRPKTSGIEPEEQTQNPDKFNVFAALRANTKIIDKYRKDQQSRSTRHIPTPEELAKMSPVQRRATDYWSKIREMSGRSSSSYSSSSLRSYSSENIWADASDGAKIGLLVAGMVLATGGIVTAVNASVDAGYGDARAEQYLTGMGYRDVREIGKSILFAGWQGCDSSDNVIYKFDVTTADERQARMAVCVGLWKGATARELR